MKVNGQLQKQDDEEPLALLDRVSFSYDGGSTWALDGVSLQIRKGEHLCILGANGSGKSTLGRLLAGALAPDQGQVCLFGRTVFDDSSDPQTRVNVEAYRQARHQIGMVFQNPEDQLVTTVTEDDVAFGPENLSTPRTLMVSQVARALRAVEMEKSAGKDPTTMSGGQQQKVAIAGSLASEPKMIIMDEPGAMLDTLGRADISTIVDQLVCAGKTVVHITHLLEDAQSADRVLVLDHGRIVAQGDPAEVVPEPNPLRVEGMHEFSNLSKVPLVPCQTPYQEPTNQSGSPVSAGPVREEQAPAIDCRELSFSFDKKDTPILKKVSFQVPRGTTLAILGPNGSGKSTLARLLCALLKPSSGQLTVADIELGHSVRLHPKKRRELRLLRHRVGFVMQKPEQQLFAQTVFQDVAFGPQNLGLGPDEVKDRVHQTLTLLDLSDLADRSPFELSGGQQRLVAIAGVLACQPEVLILDEVTANLDPYAKEKILHLLSNLHNQGVTIVMNTHDLDEVRVLADAAILLDHGHVRASGGVDRVIKSYQEMTLTAEDLGITDQTPSESGKGQDRIPATPLKPDQKSSTPSRQVTGKRQATALMVRLDPRIKIVTFLVMMLTAFLISTPPQLVSGCLVTMMVITLSGIRPARLFKSLRGFLILLLILAPCNLLLTRTGKILISWGPLLVTWDGLWVALLYSVRLGLVIILGAVLIGTSTPTQMTDAFESLLRPLGRMGIHTSEISLVLSLALRFIPTLGHELRDVVEAQTARGGSIEIGSLLDRLRAMTSIIIPVFASAIRHADNLGQALDARCYEGGQGRSHYRLMHICGLDLIFSCLVLLYLLLLAVLS